MDGHLTPTPISHMHSGQSSSSTGTADEDEHRFDSPNEEAAYYRDKYRHAADLLEETRAELDEFQASSKELEDELERELATTEKQQGELKERIKRLEGEKEEWKSKHVALQKMHSSTTAAMQREMDNLRSERDKTLVALRDLEVGNDELERNERVAASSLLDLESRYNRAIEEKTLLEQEVVIKGELEEQLQRLKTDLRDSNDQVSILRDQLARNNLPTPPSSISAPISPSLSSHHLPDLESSSAPISPPPPPLPPKSHAALGLTRSITSSHIPTASPGAKRFSTQLPASPSLSRSTTSRNLSSPAMQRSTTGGPGGIPRSPAPLRSTSQSHKGYLDKLRVLQARMKARDEKLSTADTRGPVAKTFGGLGLTRRAGAIPGRAASRMGSRAEELLRKPSRDAHTTPTAPAGVMSPTGWVLADGSDQDDTPTGAWAAGSMRYTDPESPLEAVRPASRAPSGASSRRTTDLPPRPTIPSPLMNLAAQSAALRARDKERDADRPPVSSGLSRSTFLSQSTSVSASSAASSSSTRPASRSALGTSTSRAPSRPEISHARAASRTGLPTSSRTQSAQGVRPPSRTTSRPASRVERERPLSPGIGLGHASRPKSPGIGLGPGPGFHSLGVASAQPSTPLAKPVSRATELARERRASQSHTRAHSVLSGSGTGTGAGAIGRGPPPVSGGMAGLSVQRRESIGRVSPGQTHLGGLSASTSSPGLALRRSVRGGVGGVVTPRGTRTALARDGDGDGADEGEVGDELPDTPGLRRSVVGVNGLVRTPSMKGRPVSVPNFGTPPDVPRIPSAHYRAKDQDRERDRDREREKERRRTVVHD